MTSPYDPLTIANLMMGFVVEFEWQPRMPLAKEQESFGRAYIHCITQEISMRMKKLRAPIGQYMLEKQRQREHA